MTRNNLWQVSSSNVNLWQALALYGNSISQLQDLLIYDNNVKHALASNDRQFWTYWKLLSSLLVVTTNA